ncbi:MAG TPA: hypothetical protein DCY79_19435 [Planctomycetaceae bacterium]|nr:hypothetical protein [Blastopirellula sp.]HAY81982.1 hypothetical protein [Planctomycetaceae bacterium]
MPHADIFAEDLCVRYFLNLLRWQIVALVVCGVTAGHAQDEIAFSRTFVTGKNILVRGGLPNARLRFDRQKQGHVAFIGGSITEMPGYRPRVCRVLTEQFPDTKFTFTAAGISSTCSTTGAFRLHRDVLAKGPVDLFFIEFAVNDDQDAGHTRTACIRGLEGIVRQTRRHNPHAEMVITYFVNPGMLSKLQRGEVPVSIAAHEEVAKHYQIPTIFLAQEVADQIAAGKLSWQQYGGTHPKPFGNSVCATMIERLFQTTWNRAPGELQRHDLPKMLDAFSYARGRFLPLPAAELPQGWQFHRPEWDKLPGNCRTRFRQAKLLCAHNLAQPLQVRFSGTAIGAYLLAGPDSCNVSYTIDGQRSQKPLMTYHRFSKGLHYPRTVMFAEDLQEGQHTLILQPVPEGEADGRGAALRILALVAN